MIDYDPQREALRGDHFCYLLPFGGMLMKTSEIEREVGLTEGRIASRLAAGWSVNDAITTPVAKRARRECTITYDGERMTLAQASRRYGIPRGVLWARLKRGWGAERALTAPVREQARPVILDDDERARLVRLYRAGATSRDLARRFGVTRRTVFRIVSRAD